MGEIELDEQSFFEILSNVRRYNGTLTYARYRREISQLSESESAAHVVAWLESLEKTTVVDFEMILYAAWLCSCLSGLDNAIVTWIEHNPSAARFEVALNFIGGYWGGRHSASGKSLQFVKAVVERGLDKDGPGYIAALQALHAVADPVSTMNLEEQERRDLSNLLLLHLPNIARRGDSEDLVRSLNNLKDFETRKYFSIFDGAKDLEPTALDGRPLSEISIGLTKWLEVWANPERFDPEKLWYAGRFMGYARSGGVDEYLCKWLSEDQSMRRYAVVSAFLVGYWKEANPVCQSCVEMLRAALRLESTCNETRKQITLALAVAEENSMGTKFA